MSTETGFSPFSFPALPDGSRADQRASIRGHTAGYAAGRRLAEQELEALRESIVRESVQRAEQASAELQLALEALERSAEEFNNRELPLLNSVDAAIAAAAVELAEVIIGRELSSADDSARAAVARAMQEVVAPANVVRLNPEDIATITARGRHKPRIELVADATLSRGDAVVELADGSIDARVSSSLARARAALQGGTP